MGKFADRRWQIAGSDLLAPPIVFGTAALGNVPDVIPDPRKLAICDSWFRNLEPPVLINAAYRDGDGRALEVLGRMLTRLDISANEVVVHLTLDAERVSDDWEKSCRLLGSKYQPKLISLGNANLEAWRTVSEWKAAGLVSGAGVVTIDFHETSFLAPAMDWVLLTKGFTVMRHSEKLLASMADLAARRIPLIVSGVFEGGFLLGGNRLDGRLLGSVDPADRSLLAWRTSFAALCHGHGVVPAQACIQFALSAPGVAAVLLNSSHPDRVAENADFAERPASDVFWASMKEEGLLAAHCGFVGK